ncbi:acetyl-CoA carboxylase, partial [Streptomyces smyrnaeus]
MRPTARTLLSQVASGFTEFDPPKDRPSKADGPLGWPGYDEMRAQAQARTGESESVVSGTGRIGEAETVLLCFEFGYLGGSVAPPSGDLPEPGHTSGRERAGRGRPRVATRASGGRA